MGNLREHPQRTRLSSVYFLKKVKLGMQKQRDGGDHSRGEEEPYS